MFLQKLSIILDHLRVYDSEREGSLRIDANVSLEGGQRVEVKNITGFRAVEDALNYEIIRQGSMANMGISVLRETRHYDAESNITSTLRMKEEEEDYGYITEPDLVRINVDKDWLARLETEMPELPDARIHRYTEEFGLSIFQAGVIVNTGLDLSRFFEESISLYVNPKKIANWIVTFLLKSLNYEGLRLKDTKVKPETFVEILELIDEGVITQRLARELIKEYVSTGESPRVIVRNKELAIAGSNELDNAVKEVIINNRKAVSDYKAGREKALDYLLGQVLRKIRARGNPVELKRLIREAIERD
jgi:aspartyl-tRNA(Asn)/glutamyl-tRNA(Gln) amidotransferase subunit B